MNIEELLQQLKRQQEELNRLKKENESLRKELEEEDYSDWCSIDMGAFTTNLAYTNVILTKEGSHLIKDFKNYVEEMQSELCSKVLEQGKINEDILYIVDENTYEVWNKLEDTINIITYKEGEKRQLLAKSDKFNQWLDSIEKRYGNYIFHHGYDYWLERGVDLCKPVKLSIRYYSQDKYDITNLSKHFIDYLFSNWNDEDTKKWFEVEYPVLDDDMIYWLDERRIGRSDDDYYSSKIFWKFENIDKELDVRTKADIKNRKIKDFKMKK